MEDKYSDKRTAVTVLNRTTPPKKGRLQVHLSINYWHCSYNSNNKRDIVENKYQTNRIQMVKYYEDIKRINKKRNLSHKTKSYKVNYIHFPGMDTSGVKIYILVYNLM